MTASGPAPALRAFRLVCALLALSFFFPAWTYLLAPESGVASFEALGRALGGGDYAWRAGEGGWLWRVLASGNVLTLAFMCGLLAWDPRRFSPVLAPLAFMKGFASLAYLGVWLRTGYPAFLAVSAWDAVNVGLLLGFFRRIRI